MRKEEGGADLLPSLALSGPLDRLALAFRQRAGSVRLLGRDRRFGGVTSSGDLRSSGCRRPPWRKIDSIMFSSWRTLPGPPVALKRLERPGFQPVIRFAKSRPNFSMKCCVRNGMSVDPRPKGGMSIRITSETVVEILSQDPLRDRVLDITVRRRNETDVDLDLVHVPHLVARCAPG